MKLTGFCEKCHKIKMVSVNMGRWGGRGTPVGTCDQCAERELHPSKGGH